LVAEIRKVSVEVAKLRKTSWESLIDNHLSKWVRYTDGATVGKAWRVSDGVLRIAGGSSGDIRTRKQYSDFELEFEWKLGLNGNSGVFYRVAPGTMESWPGGAGPEYQLLDEVNFQQPLKAEQKSAAIYGLFGPRNVATRPVGEWNQSRVIARGTHIEHWLNGSKAAEVEIGSHAWNAALVRYGRLEKFPEFAKSPSGFIVLQDHKSVVSYRKIRIRESAPVNATNGTPKRN
jgi:hypothetical protein